MNLKETVDKYLLEKWETVCNDKQLSGFKWSDIARSIANKFNIDVPDSEYVRNRFRKLQKPNNKTLVTNTTSNVKYQYVSGKQDDTSKEFTFTADNIPTQEEIIEHFKIDTVKFRINQIYHKTSFGGKYAITVSLLANKPEFSVDYKKEFQEFVDNYNLKKLSPSIIQKQTSFKQSKTSVLLDRKSTRLNSSHT